MIFHRVLPSPDPFLASDPDALQFAALMKMVRGHFAPLSLSEGLDRLRLGSLPARAICVTFDDGYADNLTVAAPILNGLRIPATVFVASGYLDGTAMWNDRIAEAVRRFPGETMDLRDFGCGVHDLLDVGQRARLVDLLLRRFKYRPPDEREGVANALVARYAPDMDSPMLTRAQVRELRDSGIEIGGHTVTHPILALTEERAAYDEIAGNKEDLESLLGERLRFFAYPNGKPAKDFSPIHATMAKRIGYEAALTTRPGVSTVATDPFWLPRFTPWERDPARFAIRLLLNMRAMV
jgi:peptidoglycan/xylan/chitin deacetylase (PgdA/CDA1 family)